MRRLRINNLKPSIVLPIFLGILFFFYFLFGCFSPFTASHSLFTFLFWTTVNLYGVNLLLLKKLKFKSIIFLMVTLFMFCLLFQRFYTSFFLKIFSLSFYSFIIIVIFYMKSPKKYIKLFLLSQQFLFFIVLTISLANIETHFLKKEEVSLGSRYLHVGLACFILYSFFYYMEKTGLNGQIYKTRLLLLPVSVMGSSFGTSLILNGFGIYNFSSFVGIFGGLVIPLVLLFLLRRKYKRYN